MQEQESGKSNLEFPASRFSAANSMTRKHRKSLISLSLIAAFFLTAASAQESKNSQPEQATTSAITTKAINLWPGIAPMSEQWKQPETNLGLGGMETTVNVSTPTLTAYLPDPHRRHHRPRRRLHRVVNQLRRSRSSEVARGPRFRGHRFEVPNGSTRRQG